MIGNSKIPSSSDAKISKLTYLKLENLHSKQDFRFFEAERLDTGKIATGKMWWVLSDFAIFFPGHILPGR